MRLDFSECDTVVRAPLNLHGVSSRDHDTSMRTTRNPRKTFQDHKMHFIHDH